MILLASLLFATQIRVAVIDTGYNREDNNFTQCSDVGKDLTNTSFNDESNHGNHMSHIIEYKTKYPSKYCQIIVKYVNSGNPLSLMQSTESTIKAFEYILSLNKHTHIINYSASGTEKINNNQLQDFIDNKVKSLPITPLSLKNLLKERLVIKQLLDRGTKIVVAAGNEGKEVTKENCNVFPACHDDRIIVVGYKFNDEFKSNYGSFVDYYEEGYKIKTISGEVTGSSPAAAIRSAKELDALVEKEQNEE